MRRLRLIPSIGLLAVCSVALTSRVWAGNITAIWANDGGDKVTQDELRVTRHVENLTGKVINRTWDGQTIHLYGAHNEEISFNLVLEAPFASASNVTVTFDTLTGPNGATIHSVPTSGNGVFTWTNRPIELFLARYVQINNLSWLEYTEEYDPSVPVRFQQKNGTGGWTARPDHGKYYPDPLVPLEVAQPFTIAASHNQSIWSDIYIPKSVPAGDYTGNVIVKEGGSTSWTVPVHLTVYNFALPDVPTAKTFMVGVDDSLIMDDWYARRDIYGGPDLDRVITISDRFVELFHRHKIDPLGDDACNNTEMDPACPTGWKCTPCSHTMARLNGSLFTAANGYDGPGVGQPVAVYSINTYGTPKDMYFVSQASTYKYLDEWVNWFKQYSPQTQYWLYTCDEPLSNSICNTAQTKAFIDVIKANPGPGGQMPTLSTINQVSARDLIPNLDISVSPAGDRHCPGGVETCDVTSMMEQDAGYYRTTPGKHFYAYNAHRPSTGSDATEDDGVAMRTIGWAQFKKKVERWYYWYTMPTNDNFFQQSVTFGSCSPDPSVGQASCANGDGLVVYPGTQIKYPSDSYNIDGPIASLRLKEWRRGIQDADYLALASQVNASAVQNIINRMIPYVLWETPPGVNSVWGTGPISWSVDPDDWETARAQLAQIIIGSNLPPTPVLAVTPVVVNFRGVQGDPNPAAQTVKVTDIGTGGMTWSGSSPSASWLSVSSLTGTVAAGDSQPLSLSVDLSGLTPGQYQDSFVVTAPNAGAPQTVNVSLMVAPEGSGSLSPDTMEVQFSTFSGNGVLPSQTIRLSNTGKNTISWTLLTFGSTPNWLTVSPGSGSADGGQNNALTLTANATGVSPGSYTQAIVLIAPNALNNPQILWADLLVKSLGGRASTAFSNAGRVYPNPWRKDRNSSIPITFDQVPADAKVQIFTLSGREVASTTADGNGRALWNPKDAASGLYLYLVSDGHGNSAHGKFAVIH